MWEVILTVALQIAGAVLSNNANKKEMMERFFQFVERIQSMYLKSAHLREDSKARWKAISEKPFVESP